MSRSRLCYSTITIIQVAIIDSSTFLIVLRRAIGLKDFSVVGLSQFLQSRIVVESLKYARQCPRSRLVLKIYTSVFIIVSKVNLMTLFVILSRPSALLFLRLLIVIITSQVVILQYLSSSRQLLPYSQNYRMSLMSTTSRREKNNLLRASTFPFIVLTSQSLFQAVTLSIGIQASLKVLQFLRPLTSLQSSCILPNALTTCSFYLSLFIFLIAYFS